MQHVKKFREQFRVALCPKRVRRFEWQSLTANAPCLFASAALPFRFLPRLTTLATLLRSGQRDYYGPEMTSTISPFGGWAW